MAKKRCVCKESDDDCCGAVEPSEVLPYICTRLKGHRGNHVACGLLCHRIAEWPQEAKQKPAKAKKEAAK